MDSSHGFGSMDSYHGIITNIIRVFCWGNTFIIASIRISGPNNIYLPKNYAGRPQPYILKFGTAYN